jgi:hypothetical protein
MRSVFTAALKILDSALPVSAALHRDGIVPRPGKDAREKEIRHEQQKHSSRLSPGSP